MRDAILVVDDQRELRLLIRLSLITLGRVETAASVAEAMAIVHADPPRRAAEAVLSSALRCLSTRS